jgi:hypothetical protein
VSLLACRLQLRVQPACRGRAGQPGVDEAVPSRELQKCPVGQVQSRAEKSEKPSSAMRLHRLKGAALCVGIHPIIIINLLLSAFWLHALCNIILQWKIIARYRHSILHARCVNRSPSSLQVEVRKIQMAQAQEGHRWKIQGFHLTPKVSGFPFQSQTYFAVLLNSIRSLEE